MNRDKNWCMCNTNIIVKTTAKRQVKMKLVKTTLTEGRGRRIPEREDA